MVTLIGSEWFPEGETKDWVPRGEIAIAPTQLSIAEYAIACDVIILWGWLPENFVFYAKLNEDWLQTTARVIAHEEMHRIIYQLEGEHATFQYDNITLTEIEDLV